MEVGDREAGGLLSNTQECLGQVAQGGLGATL